MNRNKVALGVLCVVVTATLAYNQTQQLGQVKQSSSSIVLKEENNVSLSASLDSTVSNSLAPAELKEIQLDEIKTTSLSSSVNKQNASNHLPSTYVQPAEHRSARQPKHHGHEHAQQQRHPEDNSIIPPGEPKKPLPEQKDNS